MALENGMDVKTLSTTIGHVSSETTIDIYSHITDTMQRQAAAKIDRQIGGSNAEIPRVAEQVKVDIPSRPISSRTSQNAANPERAV